MAAPLSLSHGSGIKYHQRATRGQNEIDGGRLDRFTKALSRGRTGYSLDENHVLHTCARATTSNSPSRKNDANSSIFRDEQASKLNPAHRSRIVNSCIQVRSKTCEDEHLIKRNASDQNETTDSTSIKGQIFQRCKSENATSSTQARSNLQESKLKPRVITKRWQEADRKRLLRERLTQELNFDCIKAHQLICLYRRVHLARN